MGSGDCECSHLISHIASEKWEVRLKRGFPFLKFPALSDPPEFQLQGPSTSTQMQRSTECLPDSVCACAEFAQ